MDKHTPEQRRKNMQAIKASGSKIELLFGKGLWSRGFRYRKNDRSVFGKPDFTFKKYKLAIFVDSEFWHGKDWANKKHEHKSNQVFWHTKIGKNIQRDKEVNKALKAQGWRVLRFWGKDIEKRLNFCIFKVEKVLLNKKTE